MQYGYSNRNVVAPKSTSTSSSTLRGRTQSPAMNRGSVTSYVTSTPSGMSPTSILTGNQYRNPSTTTNYTSSYRNSYTNPYSYSNSSSSSSPSAAAVATAARRYPSTSTTRQYTTTNPSNDFYLNRLNNNASNVASNKRIPVRLDNMTDYSSPPPYHVSSFLTCLIN